MIEINQVQPELLKNYTDVVVDDEIVFYYDGMAMETEPLQVSTVYAITLKTPADRNIEEKWAMIPMVISSIPSDLYELCGYPTAKSKEKEL